MMEEKDGDKLNQFVSGINYWKDEPLDAQLPALILNFNIILTKSYLS